MGVRVNKPMGQIKQTQSASEELSLVRTKLAPHRAARGVLDRPELVSRLEEGADNPLILLRAPAGFGKTTLAGQWRQTLIGRGCDVVWISLDPDDNDETQFLSYLLQALEGKGNVVKGALSLHRRGAEGGYGALARALVNDLSHIETPLYIFLDDFHHIKSPALNQFVSDVIAQGPEHLHFVLVTRSEPAFSLTDLRMRSLITEIAVEDLRFRYSEARAFLVEHAGSRVTSQQAQTVMDVTDGWVTAIQWVSIALKRSGDAEGLLANPGKGTEALVETIAKETLDALPARMEEFLLMTSILERFDTDLCTAVTGRPDAGEILQSLEAENLFVLPVENQPNWFRYHPLFAKYLRERLLRRYVRETQALTASLDRLLQEKSGDDALDQALAVAAQERSPIDVFELHRRAAQWFKERRSVASAVRHALSAGDKNMMLDMMEDSAMELIEQGELHTLIAWRDRIDTETLSRRPNLVQAFGWAYALTCQLDRAEDMLTLFRELTAGERDADYQGRVLEAVIEAYRDKVSGPLKLRDMPMREDLSFTGGAHCSCLGFALIMKGEFQAARDTLDLAEYNPVVGGLHFPAVYRHAIRGLSYMMEGQLGRAEESLKVGLELAERLYGRRSTAACVVTGTLAELLYEQNRLEALGRLLANRLDVLNESVYADGILRANRAGMRLHFHMGQADIAAGVFQNLCEYGEAHTMPRVCATAHCERIRHFVMDGDIDAAVTDLALIEQKLANVGYQQYETRAEIDLLLDQARAKIALAQGQYDAAEEIVDSLIRTYSGVNRRLLHAELNMMQAMVKHGQGEAENALAFMARALQIGEQSGMKRTFLDELPAIRPLLEQLAHASDTQEYQKRYISALVEADQPAGEGGMRRQAEKPIYVPSHMPEVEDFGGLSEREYQILELLGQGMPNKRIAIVLDISAETVKWHLKRLYQKLEVSSRLHAVDKARAMRLI